MVYCRKCGKDETETKMQEHHLFPKAHAIMNNINPDVEGRVALCQQCHKRLHLLLGQVDQFIGKMYVEKTRGRDNDPPTTK